jgi:DNA-binding GntR family transcriptional regulator
VSLPQTSRSGPPRLEDMLQELRFRICATDPNTTVMLHEGKLAQEFGVSRTPVRQVLQRLSFEHMLETRSGVGTVVRPLRAEQRGLHFSMLSDMLKLCTRCCASSFAMPARIQLATIADLLSNPGRPPVDSYFAIRAGLLELVSGLVLDPIAAEAHAALHWRVIRWRMQAAHENSDGAFQLLRAPMTEVLAAQTPTDLLSILAAETA